MNMMDAYTIYMMITVVNVVVFGATMLIQLRKYKKKRNVLHFWASSAFFMLLVQELIVAVWIIQIISFMHVNPSAIAVQQEIASKPWHLQALSVLISLGMLGLSMTGKITDRPTLRRKR